MSLAERVRRLERQRKESGQEIDGWVTVLYDLTPDEEKACLIALGEDVGNTIYIDFETKERIDYGNP